MKTFPPRLSSHRIQDLSVPPAHSTNYNRISRIRRIITTVTSCLLIFSLTFYDIAAGISRWHSLFWI